MKNLSEIKSHNPGLKEAEVEGILYVLLHKNDLTNNELIRITGIPKETLKRFKSSIAHLLADEGGDGVKLSFEGSEEVKMLNPKPYKWCLATEENPLIAAKISEIRKKISEENHLSPKRDLDQFFATPETTSAKVQVLIDKGLVKNKKIALLGDDDLVSVGLALTEEKPQKITVFDVDKSVLSLIEALNAELDVKSTQCEHYDCSDNLRTALQGSADVVMTDPPYTKAGISLFLNRAIQLIGDKEGHIFLFYGNSFKTPEKFIKIQEVINRFNLVIEDKIDKFARYCGAESIGSASSLYILKTTKHTNPISEELLPRQIYTYQNTKEEKFPYVDHVVAKLHGVPVSIIESRRKMLEAAGKLCTDHKLKVTDSKITDFKGGGLTITFILANSNLTIHTWPEYKAIHLDLITCKPIYEKEKLPASLSKHFGTKKIEYSVLE